MHKKEGRKDIIQKMLEEKKSYSQIGEYLNVSKQRVHQIWKGYYSPAQKHGQRNK